MTFKYKKINKKILLLEFKTQYDMCMSMIRIQEFCENLKFKGRFFSLEEYMDYEAKASKEKCFTYLTDHCGFMLDNYQIYYWRSRFPKQDQREREVSVIETIKGAQMGNEFCVIALYSGKEFDSALRHELAHSFYFLYPGYRLKCKDLIKRLPQKIKKKNIAILRKEGYNISKKILYDELQAYLSVKDGLDIEPRKEFVKNFNSFKARTKIKI